MSFSSASTSRAPCPTPSPSPHRPKRWDTPPDQFYIASIIIFIILLANNLFRESQPDTHHIFPPSSNHSLLSLPRWKENAIPTPGKTYIITALDLPQSPASILPPPPSPDQEHHHRKAITLVQGQLKLLDLTVANLTNGCWNWQCVTKEGWLGFRNVASGTYLGHNGKLEIVANAPHCKPWEWFCVRRVPAVKRRAEKEDERDGYVMLLRHWDSLRRLDVSSTPDGDSNMERWYLTGSERSAVWGFVEVGDHEA